MATTTTTTSYLKLGRGGAGNYLSPTTQTLQDATTTHSSLSSPAADIESQPPTHPALTTTTTAAAAKGQQAAATAEYAHSGRGGAGNWFSPRELDATGTFATTAPSPPSSSSSLGTAVDGTFCSSTATNGDDGTAFQPATAPAPALASSVPVAAGPTYYGRGGAGNFNARCVEEGRRKVGEEEERERERRREEVGEMVRREVERGLRRPEGAYLRGGGGRAVEVEEV